MIRGLENKKRGRRKVEEKIRRRRLKNTEERTLMRKLKGF